MTIQSLRLIDLYNLTDLNLNSDETVQSIVNSIIEVRQNKIFYKELKRVWKK